MKQLNWYQIFGETKTIPDGKTVTPTDDIQILLHCADIWDKAYTTIAEIITDTITLTAIIVDNNSIDYLVRSTTWASSVTSNSTAMTLIGANNYASNALTADATWCEAIGESEYVDSVLNAKIPKMTTNTTPSGVASASSAYSGRPAYRAFDRDMNTTWNGNVAGSSGQTLEAGWIQYQFTNAVSAKYLTIYTSIPCPLIVVMGSNDGVTFEDVASVENIPNNEQFGSALLNSENYIYYRCKVTQKNTSGGTLMMPVITELQLYGREDV